MNESKFSIIEKKSFNYGNYHIEIDTPPSPNTLFMNYAVQCSKDMLVKSISANTLSPIPFDQAKERQEDF